MTLRLHPVVNGDGELREGIETVMTFEEIAPKAAPESRAWSRRRSLVMVGGRGWADAPPPIARALSAPRKRSRPMLSGGKGRLSRRGCKMLLGAFARRGGLRALVLSEAAPQSAYLVPPNE